MNELIDKKYTSHMIETIRKMYAKDSTNEEFVVFITLCQKYDLDPMLNEIYFIKYGGQKPLMMTSRDGYLKIANRDIQFDGMIGDVIYEGDIITKKDDGTIHITYGDNHLNFNHNKITGAFCSVYRKDRSKCSSILVSFKDYNKNSPIWKSNPNAMILKVAESMALKRAFSINGLITKEEIEKDEDDFIIESTPSKKSKAQDSEKTIDRPNDITQEQLELLEIELDGQPLLEEEVLERLKIKKLQHVPKAFFINTLDHIRKVKALRSNIPSNIQK